MKIYSTTSLGRCLGVKSLGKQGGRIIFGHGQVPNGAGLPRRSWRRAYQRRSTLSPESWPG